MIFVRSEMVERRQDSSPADLYLVGLGLRLSHLTEESKEALTLSRKVLYTSYVPGTGALLMQYCDDVEDVSHLYSHHTNRIETYKRMAGLAIEAALEATPVSLALYGHPLLLSLPAMLCIRGGAKLGVRVRAIPAVSALDCLMVDLEVDIVGMGVQMHEATDVLLYQRTLVPEIATVLWQIGVLGTRLHSHHVHSTVERLDELVNYLLRFYVPDHAAVLITSSVTDEPPEVRRTSVANLPQFASTLTAATTLYLPPQPGSGHVDRDVHQRLADPAYLDSVSLPRASSDRASR